MPPRQRYEWDEASARYKDRISGRFVAAAKVRQVIDATLRNIRLDVRNLSDAVRAGRLSRQEWAILMRERVRQVHLLSGAAARGGFANLDQSAYGQIGAAVREQNAFLDAFTADVLTGRQPMDGRFTQRATLYVEAGRSTYERAHRSVEQEAGKTEERNVLRDAAHCGECPGLTDLGWVPIGTLPVPGTRTCLGNCKCRIETRTVEAA